MSSNNYSADELDRYFNDPTARRTKVGEEHGKLLLKWLAILGGGFVALMLLFLLVLSFSLPPIEHIENPEYLESTIVYTSDGVELARYYLGQNRTWVHSDRISDAMKDAVVAVEDRRFFNHWGVDIRGFAAVFRESLTSGGRMRGASTLSMQLARNLYEQIGFQRTTTRKLREILTAIQIERRYTKDEIIEMYLNTVPWGHNTYGIEAASQTYFGKPAAELEVQEAAVLAGMLQGTTRYSPTRNPERSQSRRNVVLATMVREGYLERDRFEELRTEPIELDFQPYSHIDNLAPHLAEILRLELREWGRTNGYDIYTDGLIVHTSIDSRVQQLAQEAVDAQMEMLQAVVDVEWATRQFRQSGNERDYLGYRENLSVEPWTYFWESRTTLADSFIRESEQYRNLTREGMSGEEALAHLKTDAVFIDSLRTAKTRLETGLVAMNPTTGYVTAWVGGKNFAEDQYDHVQLARRQSGSVFKPFVYIAAIDNGYSPLYQVMDSTFVWTEPGAPPWRPRNAGGTSGQYVTLRRALAASLNIPTARLTQMITPRQVELYARRMGVNSPLQPVPSIGLGVADVTLLEMVSAYGSLANGGVVFQPQVITRIEDRQGNLLAEFQPQESEALSPNTAYTVVDMMRAVIDGGTGQRIRWRYGGQGYDFAGKTGTTQESADGWFILIHPDLVVGSWVGFNDRRVQFRTFQWGQGSRNALAVVGQFTQRIIQSDDPAVRLNQGRRFERPAGYVEPAPPPPPEPERSAVRDLLDQWEQRDQELSGNRNIPEKREEESRGRVGW